MSIPLIGAGIAAGAALLGGKMQSDAARDNTQAQIEFNTSQSAHSEALQREFARNGIKWRAQDAREAGLHPLFALGGSGATYTPSAATLNFDQGGGHMGKALADAGQHVGRAVSAQQTPEQRALHAAQLQQLAASSERDLAQATYYRSLAAREATNPPMPGGNDTVTGAYAFPVSADGRGHRIESHPLYADAVKLKPDEMASRHVQQIGQTAGQDHPGMREFIFPGGFRMLLPATDGGGVPEEIDASMLPTILGSNLAKYGSGWLLDYGRHVMGGNVVDEGGSIIDRIKRSMQERRKQYERGER